MRIRLLGLAALLVSAVPPLHAQRPAYYFLELGGVGGLASVNVELNPIANLRLRGGAGYFIWPSVPLMASYTIGSPRHSVELGVGTTVVFLSAFGSRSAHTGPNDLFELNEGSGTLVIGTAMAGYRYTSPKGFLVRVALTPLYAQGKGVMWVGLSLGRAF